MTDAQVDFGSAGASGTDASGAGAAPAGLRGVNLARLERARENRTPPPPPGQQTGAKSAMHKLLLALVWLTVASGSFVFDEPAPIDILTGLLIVCLPAAGLLRITPSLLLLACLWLMIAAAAFAASMSAPDIATSLGHTTIPIYLYCAAFLFAAFTARNPLAHTRLILNAYLFAAVVGAIAGLVGYFDLIAGAHQLLTKYGRASGTFKDPNVYGPFLIPALLYAIHLTVNRPPLRAAPALLQSLIIGTAIMLSFSRGAWLALALALSVWGYMSFVTVPSNRQRLKLIALALAGLLLAANMVTAALQSDRVSQLYSVRASLHQSYDYGPDGRFAGHDKARAIILETPFGFGAKTFTRHIHPEDVHNVYLSLFLSAGWLGGFLYVFIIALSAVYGLRHGFRRCPTQPLFLLIYAAFIGNIAQGLFIDSDHWRHFYLLLGMLWGLMAATGKAPALSPPQQPPQPRPPRLYRRRRQQRRATLDGPAGPCRHARRRPPTGRRRRPGKHRQQRRRQQRRPVTQRRWRARRHRHASHRLIPMCKP